MLDFIQEGGKGQAELKNQLCCGHVLSLHVCVSDVHKSVHVAVRNYNNDQP